MTTAALAAMTAHESPEPQYVRDTTQARALAERDVRVRLVLVEHDGAEYEPQAVPGTPAYKVRQLRAAALTLVELYRLGYRVGWDGLKTYAACTTNPANPLYLASPYAPDVAQVVARAMIADELAWPEL